MTRKTRMILFFAIQAVFIMTANFAHAVTPAFFIELGLGDHMFGIALGSMLTINFCVAPFWGKLIDYISSKTALLIGSLGYAAGQAFFMLSTTGSGIISARMFAGIFSSASFVALLTYVVNISRDDRERAYYMTVGATIMGICSSFGFLIGGLLGEISISTAIMAQVIGIAACGILFFIVCEKDAKINIKEVEIKTVIKNSNPLAAFLASRHFMNFVLFALFAVVISQSIGMTSFEHSFNYFVREQFYFSTGYNGIIRGVIGILILIVNSTVTLWIINKTDMRKSLIWIFLTSSAMIFLAIMTSANALPFVIVSMAVFVGGAVSMPLVQNMIAKNAVGENSNLVIGFFSAMRSLGGIIGAFMAGILYGIAPIGPFVLGLMACLCAGGFAWVYYRKSRSVVN